MVKRTALGQRLGETRMFFTVAKAVQAYQARDLTQRA
jgi:hypothetical protein